jgi:hypothetical protein
MYEEAKQEEGKRERIVKEIKIKMRNECGGDLYSYSFYSCGFLQNVCKKICNVSLGGIAASYCTRVLPV